MFITVLILGAPFLAASYFNFTLAQCQKKINRVNTDAEWRWANCKHLNYPDGCIESANKDFMSEVSQLHRIGCAND